MAPKKRANPATTTNASIHFFLILQSSFTKILFYYVPWRRNVQRILTLWAITHLDLCTN